MEQDKIIPDKLETYISSVEQDKVKYKTWDMIMCFLVGFAVGITFCLVAIKLKLV